MGIEYKITYKSPEYEYWGEFATSFYNYSDAKVEFNRLLKEGSSGIYRIIRTKCEHEIVKEEETK